MSATTTAPGTAPAKTVKNTVSDAISVDRKSIQMKFFRDPDSLQECVMTKQAIALGMLVGTVHAIRRREGTLPDGKPNISLQALGDFQAVNYKSQEKADSNTAYLPNYFAEVLEAALSKSGGGGINIAVEIVVEPTGKNIGEGIPYAYGVKRLLSRHADNPLEAIKRELAAKGMLRGLTPPQMAPAKGDPLLLPDDADPETGEIADAEAGAPATAPATGKGKGRARAVAEEAAAA